MFLIKKICNFNSDITFLMEIYEWYLIMAVKVPPISLHGFFRSHSKTTRDRINERDRKPKWFIGKCQCQRQSNFRTKNALLSTKDLSFIVFRRALAGCVLFIHFSLCVSHIRVFVNSCEKIWYYVNAMHKYFRFFCLFHFEYVHTFLWH